MLELSYFSISAGENQYVTHKNFHALITDVLMYVLCVFISDALLYNILTISCHKHAMTSFMNTHTM